MRRGRSASKIAIRELGSARRRAASEVLKYHLTSGGGFCQNELILEFPTKSMPSGFRAAPCHMQLSCHVWEGKSGRDCPMLAGETRVGAALPRPLVALESLLCIALRSRD